MRTAGLKTKTRLTSLALANLMLWQFAGGTVYAQIRPLELQQQKAHTASIVSAGGSKSFDKLLSELKEAVKEGAIKTKSEPKRGFASIEKIESLKSSLGRENEKNETYFNELEQLIKDKNLSDEILKRQRQFVAEYRAKYKTLLAAVGSIEAANARATGLWAKFTGKNQNVDYDGPVNQTIAFLEASTRTDRKPKFDPHNLPHRSLKADHPIAPKLTRAEWDRAFQKDSVTTTEVASSSERHESLQKNSGNPVRSHHARKSAANNSALSTALFSTSPPTAADLAETIEVKFTPEIKALADSLDRNPVKIYNWVHNNIEFTPTWGSIQGAELCLENRAGNAFDTSSLLIALLRYSGIPARYQMGTIEVPIEKFKNWAGGFTNAEAAASLFASGGVPSVVRRVNQSSQVVSIRMEHLWVKAFVDYSPSAGAVDVTNDTWVEMDASFKQYAFSNEMDLETINPIDFQAFVDQLTANATIDPATGSITHVSGDAITSFMSQMSEERVDYISSNLANATGTQVFGTRNLISQTPSVLPASNVNRILARSAEISEIPDNLRHKLTISLSSYPQAQDTADQFSYTTTLPEIAGKRVFLNYTAATQDDEQLLESIFTAAGSDGHISIPSSLQLVPRLSVNEQVVAAGQPLPVGSAVVSAIRFSSPTISLPAISNTMRAGESTAVGLDLQGIAAAQMQQLKQRVQAIDGHLQHQELNSISGLDWAEALLEPSILEWFSFLDGANRFASKVRGVVTFRYPSAGLFYVKQRVSSLFGRPVAAEQEAFSMDIDGDVVVSAAKNGDSGKVAALSFSQGLLGSALEAEIPLNTLSATNAGMEGISTVTALTVANEQGIPIYQVTTSNAPYILPLLHISSSDLSDIQDAINAGLEVTVPQTPVNFGDQTVLGFVVSDPQTGSTSFLISGGANGAIIKYQEVVLRVLYTGLCGNPYGVCDRTYYYLQVALDEDILDAATDAMETWNAMNLTYLGTIGGPGQECYKAAFILDYVANHTVVVGDCPICAMVSNYGWRQFAKDFLGLHNC